MVKNLQIGSMDGSMADNMNTKPLISVITIFYNAEKFIDEAIKSVFSQTYDNWELLLIDDGSSDRSSEIARSYAESYPEKVHCFEHEGRQNKGMSASRNLGISKARGDYIAFLDADDVFLPQKLGRQLEILISHPEAEMVCGPTEWWYSWTQNHQDAKLDYKREISFRYDVLFKPPAFLKLLLMTKARTPATCAILARRRLFEITGGFEDSFHGMYEDQAFFFKVFLKTPVFVTSECWDRYRQHSDSSCSVAINSGLYHPDMPNTAHLNFLNWFKDYLSEQGVENREITILLRKKFLRYHYPNLFRLLNYSLRLLPKNWFSL